jgi:hypothetical protein
VPYGCPRCQRIVPLDDVDLVEMKLRCESCGQIFAFTRPDEFYRDGPPPPPPPVDLFGVPASIDVRQPGDGTLELRIRHWQRPRHGPEAFLVLNWLLIGAIIAAWAVQAGNYIVGGVFVVLSVAAVPAARRLIDAWRRRTLMRWDRVTGQIRIWSEVQGNETGPAVVANITRTRIELRRGPDGPRVTAVDGADAIALTGPMPLAIAEWVSTTLEILRKADLRASEAGGAVPPPVL